MTKFEHIAKSLEYRRRYSSSRWRKESKTIYMGKKT